MILNILFLFFLFFFFFIIVFYFFIILFYFLFTICFCCVHNFFFLIFLILIWLLGWCYSMGFSCHYIWIIFQVLFILLNCYVYLFNNNIVIYNYKISIGDLVFISQARVGEFNGVRSLSVSGKERFFIFHYFKYYK
jgi:hypothetical protein